MTKGPSSAVGPLYFIGHLTGPERRACMMHEPSVGWRF